MSHNIRFRRDSQAEFVKVFRTLSDRHSAWKAWSDFVILSAIKIAAPFGDTDDERHREWEAEYMSIKEKYSPAEQKVFSTLFALTIDAIDARPEQDFLGEIFTLLELSNHWKGQFFTPYDISRVMAEIALQDVDAKIRAKGWVGIFDCCCGAGALMIAARNYLDSAYPQISQLLGHQQTLFVCQDVDRTAALMCYIQLSLLGCAGYVVIGNALTHPLVGYDGHPVLPIETEGQEIWCMPLFHDRVWVWRQAIANLNALTRPISGTGIAKSAVSEAEKADAVCSAESHPSSSQCRVEKQTLHEPSEPRLKLF